MKVALIGLGQWGRVIANTLDVLGAEVVVLVRSENAERDAWLRETHPRFSLVRSLATVRDDPTITHVIIATPMDTHRAIAMEFMGAGKALYIEKPIAPTVAEGQEILSCAHATHTPVFIGQIFLYHPCLTTLAAELVGKRVMRAGAEKTLRAERITDPKLRFLDRFIHETSVFLKVLGTPQGCESRADTAVTFRFPGVNATASVLPADGEKIRRFLFATENETYRWENDALYLRRDGGEQRVATHSVPPLQLELQKFLSEASTPEVAENNRIALESVRLLEEAYPGA